MVAWLGRSDRLRHGPVLPELVGRRGRYLASGVAWRGKAIGIYRFWRDLGYAIGALGLGLAAHFTGQVEAAFAFVALAMFASGALLWCLGEAPRLGRADQSVRHRHASSRKLASLCAPVFTLSEIAYILLVEQDRRMHGNLWL